MVTLEAPEFIFERRLGVALVVKSRALPAKGRCVDANVGFLRLGFGVDLDFNFRLDSLSRKVRVVI